MTARASPRRRRPKAPDERREAGDVAGRASAAASTSSGSAPDGGRRDRHARGHRLGGGEAEGLRRARRHDRQRRAGAQARQLGVADASREADVGARGRAALELGTLRPVAGDDERPAGLRAGLDRDVDALLRRHPRGDERVLAVAARPACRATTRTEWPTTWSRARRAAPRAHAGARPCHRARNDERVSATPASAPLTTARAPPRRRRPPGRDPRQRSARRARVLRPVAARAVPRPRVEARPDGADEAVVVKVQHRARAPPRAPRRARASRTRASGCGRGRRARRCGATARRPRRDRARRAAAPAAARARPYARAVALEQPDLLAEVLAGSSHTRSSTTRSSPPSVAVAVVQKQDQIDRGPSYRDEPMRTAIIVPTRAARRTSTSRSRRSRPRRAAAGAELIVVDDGPAAATRAVAERHGARYVAHEASRGLNAARNTGIDATEAELLVLRRRRHRGRSRLARRAARAAAELPDESACSTGPIRARVEDHRFRACGREGAPITSLDLGAADRDCRPRLGREHGDAAQRRSSASGRFDEAARRAATATRRNGSAAGGSRRARSATSPRPALDHRRAGDDARLRALCRAAVARGRASRALDERAGTRRRWRAELRDAGGLPAARAALRCANGPVMTRAHALGRLRGGAAARRRPARRRGADGLPLRRERHRRRATRAVLARVRDAAATCAPRVGRARRLRRAARRAAAAPARARRSASSAATCRPAGRRAPSSRRSRHEVDVARRRPRDARQVREPQRAAAPSTTSRAYDWLLVRGRRRDAAARLPGPLPRPAPRARARGSRSPPTALPRTPRGP